MYHFEVSRTTLYPLRYVQACTSPYNPFPIWIPKPIENVALNSGRPHRFRLAFSPSTWNVSKIKNLKRSNFDQSVLFRAQNALCGKKGGAIIGLQVSKQDGMVFSSSPTCLSLARVSPSIPTQFWCRNQRYEGIEYQAWNQQGSESHK